MAYDGKVLARARDRYETEKERRRADFRRQRAEIYARVPRLVQIDAQLRGTVSRTIAAALRSGQDPAARVAALKEENLALQKERAAQLEQAGYPPDALTEQPACPACGDTGYGPDGAMCTCLRAYYVEEQNRELSKLLNIGAQSFETFSLDYYPREYREDCHKVPYEHMEKVARICRQYAAGFGRPGAVRNLFLTGDPGLGKTFLSACIAREVSKGGFSVVYDTATHVFSQFETNKFRRFGEEEQEEAAADVRRYLECDLLIVDDLGTELVTPFVQDALYQLINGRIVAEKRTIINSNLDEKGIRQRYSPQIASRLGGEYYTLVFVGDDIRKIRQRRI